jgi:hypothetical protein
MVNPDNNQNIRRTDEALENQDDEEIVEIDEYGRIYRPNEAPRDSEKRPTILRDPKGEY